MAVKASTLITWTAAMSGLATFIANNLLSLKLAERDEVSEKEFMLAVLAVFLGSLAPVFVVKGKLLPKLQEEMTESLGELRVERWLK